MRTWLVSFFELFKVRNVSKSQRFTGDQLVAIHGRTSSVLKLLRRRWSKRLSEEDEIEIILQLDKLRMRLERKALAAKLNFEPNAEAELISFALEVAAAANSCCIGKCIEDTYPKASDV